MNFIKGNIVGLVAIVIAIAGLYYPVASVVSNHFGNVTNYDEVDATAIKVGGTNGSRVGPVIAGNAFGTNCALVGTGGTFAASTTVAFSCPITGVVAGDIVFANAASTTNSGSGGWFIKGAVASSTAGQVDVYMVNFTGATVAVPLAIASSTQLLVLHPVSSVPGL